VHSKSAIFCAKFFRPGFELRDVRCRPRPLIQIQSHGSAQHATTSGTLGGRHPNRAIPHSLEVASLIVRPRMPATFASVASKLEHVTLRGCHEGVKDWASGWGSVRFWVGLLCVQRQRKEANHDDDDE
jgi:hypothetical protein